jgi:hypothetical protein
MKKINRKNRKIIREKAYINLLLNIFNLKLMFFFKKKNFKRNEKAKFLKIGREREKSY